MSRPALPAASAPPATAVLPMLAWFDQLRAVQLGLLDASLCVMRASLQGALPAVTSAAALRPQAELLGAACAQATRYPQALTAAWLAALGLAPAPGSTALDPARIGVEEVLRPWLALWRPPATGAST